MPPDYRLGYLELYVHIAAPIGQVDQGDTGDTDRSDGDTGPVC